MKKNTEALQKVRLWVFDADDTLWESSLFFRRAEDDFVALMLSLGFDDDETRAEIHRRDVARLSVTGYGAKPYINTLREFLTEKVESVSKYMLDCLQDISSSLLHHPLVLLPGVYQSIEAMHHAGLRMVVLTMGDEEHQHDKFNRSGIASFFDEYTVVPKKNTHTLRQLLYTYGTSPEDACMVGNSPLSDMKPAIELGVNAVFVERPHTWQAEFAEFDQTKVAAKVKAIPELLPLIGFGNTYFQRQEAR